MFKSIQSENSHRASNKKAFTLVEALVAISILMIAIASPMTLAQKGLSTATLAKDQMIAAFLAQDAIEAVRNVRDQVARTGNLAKDWLDPLSTCVCSGVNCNFDSPSPIYCTIDTAAISWGDKSIVEGEKNSIENMKTGLLKLISDNSSNFLRYGYISQSGESSTDSKFTRYINIKKTDNPDEAVVSVRVSWPSKGVPQNIDIQDFLYNYSSNF